MSYNNFHYKVALFAFIFGFIAQGSEVLANLHLQEIYRNMLIKLGVKNSNKFNLYFMTDRQKHKHSSVKAYSKYKKTFIQSDLAQSDINHQVKVLAKEAYHAANNHFLKKHVLFWGSAFVTTLTSARLITGFKIKNRNPGWPTLFATLIGTATVVFGKTPLIKYQKYQASRFAYKQKNNVFIRSK
jgi:hypothetical protein